MANPATTLARSAQDKRIPELDVLPPGTNPSTLSMPVYNPATDKTHQAPIGGPVPDTNAVPGGAKVVQYRDSRLYGVPAGALTLDRLNLLTIAPGTLATVDNPADTPLTLTKPPRQYVATVVAAGTAGAVSVPRYIGAAAGDEVLILWEEEVVTWKPVDTLEVPASAQGVVGLGLRETIVWLANHLGLGTSIPTPTPAAPVVVYNSTSRTLSATHSLGGTLQFSYQGSAFVNYIGAIQVDDAAHTPGDWQFKRLASTGYTESPAAASPAIAVKPPTNQTSFPLTSAHFSEDLYAAAKSGYTQRSAFARVSGTSNSTTLDVYLVSTTTDLITSQFVLNVNGAFFAAYTPTNTGSEEVVSITGLPATTYTYELVAGSALAAGTSQTGAYLTRLVFAAGSTSNVAAATTKANRLAVPGDSISVGGGATMPARYGWEIPLRGALGWHIGLTGSAGKSACGAFPNATEQQLEANRIVAFLAGATRKAVWWCLGTNDFGLAAGTPAQYAATAASIFDRINAADPAITVYAQSPLWRGNQATPNSLGYVLADYATALQSVAATRSAFVVFVDASTWLVQADFNTTDLLHPTDAGHAKLAGLVQQALSGALATPKLVSSSTSVVLTGTWNRGFVNNDPGAYEPTRAVGTLPGAEYEFQFSGTSFKICYGTSTAGGAMEVIIDGGAAISATQYAATPLVQAGYTSPTLSAGTHTVRVRGAASNTGYLYFDRIEAPGGYFIAPAPTISSLSRSADLVGYKLTITGTNLANTTSVVFGGGTNAVIASNTPTQLVVTIPTGAQSGPITVTTPVSAVQSSPFTVTPPTPLAQRVVTRTINAQPVGQDPGVTYTPAGNFANAPQGAGASVSGSLTYTTTPGSKYAFSDSFEQFGIAFHRSPGAATQVDVYVDGVKVSTYVMDDSSDHEVYYIIPRQAAGVHQVEVVFPATASGYFWLDRGEILQGSDYKIGFA